MILFLTNLFYISSKKKLKTNYVQVKTFEKQFGLEVDKAIQADHLIDFDEAIISRVLGHKSADEYYVKLSCIHHLSKITVPTLCVNANDDNITTSKAIPYDEFRHNDNLISLVSDHGGHIIWMDNKHAFSLNHWINEPVLDFINTLNKNKF